jgi:hypothetical protein
MKVTRRKLATILTSAAAVAQAQTTPDQELQSAKDRIKANSGLLAAQPVPMSTEPAFQFKV